MKPDRKWRVGVIGAGARGPAFAEPLHRGTDRAELFGVCDIDAERLARFCDVHGLKDARRFTDTKAFLREPDLDAVVITVPEFAHRDVAIAALAARKHVYLEKAMAVTSEECRDIIRARRAAPGVAAFLGFNLRATPFYQCVKEIVDSGILGQIIHVSAMEQVGVIHGASFMRRFHRYRKNAGGFLNTKCSHDLDIMQWVVGHGHRVRKVACFGGVNVFLPKKSPARFCHECPTDVFTRCPYRSPRRVDRAPGGGPLMGRDNPPRGAHYPGDLCVFNDDKDIIDNQTVIMEWDSGVRGNFNLQLFQNVGRREMRIFGEDGLLEASTDPEYIRVTRSTSGEVIEHKLKAAEGGHGGSDPLMLNRFLDAIESGEEPESGLSAGLAATLVAEKAEQAMACSAVVEIAPAEYL
jgi:predicted dehydrogenase